MRKSHICLNMTGGTTWIGGAIYTQNLARAIASLPMEDRSRIKLSIRVHEDNLEMVEPVRDCVDHVYVTSRWQRAVIKGRKILADRVPIFPLNLLNPENIDFLYPTVSGSRSPHPWGGWIPDFQHHHLPEMFSAEEIAERNTWHQMVARNAPVIILSSNMAKQDFDQLYPEAALRSVVMHFATALDATWFQLDPLAVQAKYELPDRFFLVSNQFWKHKGHTAIIQALALLQQQGIKPVVVCTGKTFDPRHPEYYDQLLNNIKELGLEAQIRILGLIPRVDQIQLMRRCLAVIQPSRFEGWSTVVEDARTLGRPILLSDFPVHLEQNPPYAEFFEQGNIDQLTQLISKSYAQLEPGPDFDKEELAKQENSRRVQAFGYKFLEIVRNVIQ